MSDITKMYNQRPQLKDSNDLSGLI